MLMVLSWDETQARVSPFSTAVAVAVAVEARPC